MIAPGCVFVFQGFELSFVAPLDGFCVNSLLLGQRLAAMNCDGRAVVLASRIADDGFAGWGLALIDVGPRIEAECSGQSGDDEVG